jgi:hypothetical protein
VTLAYAIVTLISIGLGFFQARVMANLQGSSANVTAGYETLALDAFGWLYPVILIIFLNTPKWKNAFAAS